MQVTGGWRRAVAGWPTPGRPLGDARCSACPLRAAGPAPGSRWEETLPCFPGNVPAARGVSTNGPSFLTFNFIEKVSKGRRRSGKILTQGGGGRELERNVCVESGVGASGLGGASPGCRHRAVSVILGAAAAALGITPFYRAD